MNMTVQGPGALRVACLSLVLCAACAGGLARFEGTPIKRGAVVSENALATRVGLAILDRGGNAADAAVATAMALCVVYPQAGNLGGGGFAILANADGKNLALDFRERAPLSTAAELYLDDQGVFDRQRSIQGPLAVGVPGSPLGLWELHQVAGSGRLSWSQLLDPAITLAREGFAVDPWLARDLRRTTVAGRMNAAARAVFYPGGEPLGVGQMLRQPALARTLSLLASEGPRGFYGGPVAEALVAELGRAHSGVEGAMRGVIDAADLALYEVQQRPPLVGYFGGREWIAMPPPSSGGLVILQVLAILDGLPLGSEVAGARAAGVTDGLGERLVHWLIEALRMAFADRAEHMGDPEFHEVPVELLLSPAWIAERRVSITDRAQPEIGPWVPAPVESSQTTHLSVLDRAGNAVSLTTTLNGWFGSGILVEEGGFFLNNELDDFAIQAGVPNQFGLVGSEANSIQPGKRPLSSMSPTVVRDAGGSVRLVIGSPGGPRIITATLQVALRLFLLEQELGAAIRAPRLHQQWSPAETLFEARGTLSFLPSVLAGLRERGQPIEEVEGSFGSVQAIFVTADGEIRASSDPRRGGSAGIEGRGISAPALPPN